MIKFIKAAENWLKIIETLSTHKNMNKCSGLLSKGYNFFLILKLWSPNLFF